MSRTHYAMYTVCVWFLNVTFVLPFKLIAMLIEYIRNKVRDSQLESCYYASEWIDDEDNEQDIQNELNKYKNLPEIPEMCQIFTLGPDTCIGVQYVSMCPDETVHIRIIGDTTFSQLYKRRVYTRNSGEKQRYFKLNNQEYYLDPKRTQPIDPTQAKEGK